MKEIAGAFVSMTLLFTWIAGVVIAKGFWWTVFSIFIPFVSWYLVVEKILIKTGLI